MSIEAGEELLVEDHAVTSDGLPGGAAANFSANSVTARTSLGGKLVYVSLALTSTNAINTSSGNIADTTVYTLDTEFRPSEAVQCIWGNGVTDGQATINTNGTVVIRTAVGNLTAGATVNITATYLKA